MQEYLKNIISKNFFYAQSKSTSNNGATNNNNSTSQGTINPPTGKHEERNEKS